MSRHSLDHARPTQNTLLKGYRRMARDGALEDEASEWSEAIIGDATGAPKGTKKTLMA